MLVIVGMAQCSGGGIRIEVQKPQSSAKAERIFPNEQAAAAVLSNFGIAQDAAEYFFKLLSSVEINQVLTFPPMDVPFHQLAGEDFRIAAAATG